MNHSKKILCVFVFLGCLNSVFSAFASSSSVDETEVLPLVSEKNPIEIVRALQLLHDNVVVNAPNAAENLQKSLYEAGREMLSFSPAIWNDKNNLYALMTYLFIGGNPNIVREIIKEIPQLPISQKIINGSLAYVYRDTSVFLESFDDDFFLDETIPMDLRLAVCLGTSLEDSLDQKKALERLDWVRLSTPGSLLEESAIRREILLLHSKSDKKLFRLLTHDYVSRFSKSPYAKIFWRSFAISMIRMAPSLTNKEIDDNLQYVYKDLKYVILCQIARSFLLSDNLVRSHAISEEAIKLALQENFPSDTARFYYAASSIGSSQLLRAKDILDTININNLLERDRALFLASLILEKNILESSEISSASNLGLKNFILSEKKEIKDPVESKTNDEEQVAFHLKTYPHLEVKKKEKALDAKLEKYLASIHLQSPKTPRISKVMLDKETNKMEEFLNQAQERVKKITSNLGNE